MKMAKLKRMLTRPGKNESGQGALAMVLLLLMLGAVILTPLLVFMSTGVKSGQVYESKLQEFYAADSGVEAAMCEISQNHTNPIVPDYPLNDRNVTVTIEDKGGGNYKINSTATSDNGGSTTIECYVMNIPSFLNLFDNAITSNGTVCVKGDVNGSVVAADCANTHACEYANCTTNTTINWPSELQFSTYYRNQVKHLDPFPDAFIDIDTDPIMGPLYRDGTLDIYNSGSAGKNATLNGTVYVTGDLDIGMTGHDFTLNLNNQTIYCEGNIRVGGKCTVTGSGCIIAVGDIEFKPKMTVGSEDNFLFIMSVEGTIFLEPNGDFYGAVVGDADVTLQPGNLLQWTDPDESEGTLNFPTETVGELTVLSYTIK